MRATADAATLKIERPPPAAEPAPLMAMPTLPIGPEATHPSDPAAGDTLSAAPTPGPLGWRAPTGSPAASGSASTSAGPAAPTGTPPRRTLGGFELLSVLGRGGMGIVYRAYQPALDRTVAVKVLTAGVDASPVEVERFRREAAAAARLKHPAIVSIHEVGEEEGALFFAMDFIDGRPLSALADEGLGPRRALELCQALAEALHYAHQQGVIHRDVKPGNVLVDRDGRPHLTDFGLAKDSRRDGLTLSNAVLGTPAYMPPEQARGDAAAVDARSDVYALGGVLYHLLCGKAPFQGDSVLDLLARVCEEEPVPPKRLVASLHRDIETICLRCLAKDPARRYATAGDLAEDIGRYLHGETILARPAGRLERLFRHARRHRVALAIALAATLATGGAAGWLVHEAGRADRQRRRDIDDALAAAHEARERGERAADDGSRLLALEAARDHYRAATVLDPGDPLAREGLTLLDVQIEAVERRRDEAARIRAELERAEAADRARREAEAAADHRRREALAARAAAFAVEGQRQLASARAGQPDPFEALGAYRAALLTFRAGLEAAAELAAAGDAERAQGLGDDLARGLRQALEARFALGLRHRKHEIAQEALDDLEALAVDVGPGRAQLAAARRSEETFEKEIQNAWALYRERRYREALDHAARARDEAADDQRPRADELIDASRAAEVERLLGLSRERDGDPVAARAALLEALALDPADPRIASALAEVEAARLCPPGFVYVRRGLFPIGSDDPEDSSPRRVVALAPFYLAVHEVTSEAYQAFLQAGGYERLAVALGPEAARVLCEADTGLAGPLSFRHGKPVRHDGARWPVTGVSFAEALAFASWFRDAQGGGGYRLPSALEWEVAASWDPRERAARPYPWGDAAPSAASGAFRFDPGRRAEDMLPEPVGQSPRDQSPLGFSDMGGNAQEWTTGEGGEPVLKGGAVNLLSVRYARAAWRAPAPQPALYRSRSTGLRLARSLPPELAAALMGEGSAARPGEDDGAPPGTVAPSIAPPPAARGGEGAAPEAPHPEAGSPEAPEAGR